MADLERVRVWAEALIRLHLDDSWAFGFDRAAKRAGLTNFTTRRITVSKHLAARWDDDEVHQTLLHEVAHAMVGPRVGHGPLWRRTAREIGYVGGRTHQGEIAAERAGWVGACPGGHQHVRFRAPRGRYACTPCTRSARRLVEVRWERRKEAA
ncbi:SprT-like family protein [Agrococcus baldri]|uniref:SprT-like family protein n=1 Tax=Agrococcus baldri TaxID=153730 RepID=A0AA94KYX1_9MICO|nr:SprT-like domain-containing protein [Agrococcus baldri]SFS03431.1 SprT-like family protein [Agrococcus baldri]